MQDYVPYNFSKNKKTRRKKRIFLSAVVILATILTVIISLNLLLKPKSEDYLKEFNYYYVYVNKNQKQAVLLAESETIRSLGGAGKILLHDNSYYLLVGVYFSESEASEIKNNIVKNFPNAGVIKITKIFDKAKKRKISSNINSVKCFKTTNEMLNVIHTNSMQYLAGSISESSLCSKILNFRHNLECMIADFSETDEFTSKILAFEELCHLHLTNFCNEFFTTKYKQAVLSELLINLSLAKCDLVDNL